MGLFKKRSTDPAELDQIKSEIASMAARLEATDAAKAALSSQIAGIAGTVDRLDTPVEPTPDAAPPATQHDIDVVNAKIERLAARLDSVDERITAISTELANQLTELSGDIETIGSQQPMSVDEVDEVVEQIRDAQTRLANEQARYQISFRQDLADVAERLRRTR